MEREEIAKVVQDIQEKILAEWWYYTEQAENEKLSLGFKNQNFHDFSKINFSEVISMGARSGEMGNEQEKMKLDRKEYYLEKFQRYVRKKIKGYLAFERGCFNETHFRSKSRFGVIQKDS